MTAAGVTWQQVQQTPEDGKRREAIGGELYVTGPATVRHQRVTQRLRMKLYRLLEDSGYGEILPGPIGVEFPSTGEGVQPDTIFISEERRDIIADDWIRGAPDLIVETVSADTAERDRGVKLDLYRRQEVPEYWIVDPADASIDVYHRSEDVLGEVARFQAGEVAASVLLAGFTVAVDDVVPTT